MCVYMCVCVHVCVCVCVCVDVVAGLKRVRLSHARWRNEITALNDQPLTLYNNCML